jgi:hypothetical protein
MPNAGDLTPSILTAGSGPSAQHGRSCRLQTPLQSGWQRRQLLSPLHPLATAAHVEQHPAGGKPPASWQAVQPDPTAAASRTICASVLAKHTWLRRLQCRGSIIADQSHDGEAGCKSCQSRMSTCQTCTVYWLESFAGDNGKVNDPLHMALQTAAPVAAHTSLMPATLQQCGGCQMHIRSGYGTDITPCASARTRSLSHLSMHGCGVGGCLSTACRSQPASQAFSSTLPAATQWSLQRLPPHHGSKHCRLTIHAGSL